jgi:hypothetical protein
MVSGRVSLLLFYLPLETTHRYAYSEEVGEESDDEEAQSLTKGKQEGRGELSLVRQEKNVRNDASSDEDDKSEEDKRE